MDVFNSMKSGLLAIDPVTFVEEHLTLDGNPFRLNGNGYKPFADIYRYIGSVSLNKQDNLNEEDKTIKPVVLVKGRQVGATTMASALSLYFMTCGLFGNNGRPPMRMIHAFPTLIHVNRYSKTKLSPMISTAVRVPDPNKPGKTKSFIETKYDKSNPAGNSLQYKQFIGGNYLQIESTGLDADRLRGGTVDAIFYDEIQDIPGVAITNANRLLTKAHYGPSGTGIQVMFGTPKSKNSNYYNIWQASNQQYYYLGCTSCGEHFPLYTPGNDDWHTKIWLYGWTVKCPHCGHEQDKRESAEIGKWVATRPLSECKYVGYHINQLYMPDFTKERIMAEHFENHELNTQRTWENEILGEFYTGDMGLITPEEIRENCADFNRKMSSRITIADNVKVYAGFDWGKKNADDSGLPQGGQSYSTAVVLVDEGNVLSIVFAMIAQKNNFEYKKGLVEQLLRQFSVTRAVGDLGYAGGLSEVLQEKHGDQFLVSESVSRITGNAKYFNEQFPKSIRFAKDFYVSEIVDLMKKGIIRFPFGDFEKISWLIDHCSSMEIKTTFNAYNEPVRRFVKGKTQNDGMMALLNAYLAYKFDKTNGFTVGRADVVNVNVDNKIPASLCYIPKM